MKKNLGIETDFCFKLRNDREDVLWRDFSEGMGDASYSSRVLRILLTLVSIATVQGASTTDTSSNYRHNPSASKGPHLRHILVPSSNLLKESPTISNRYKRQIMSSDAAGDGSHSVRHSRASKVFRRLRNEMAATNRSGSAYATIYLQQDLLPRYGKAFYYFNFTTTVR